MNVQLIPPTYASGLGEQFRQTVAALGSQDVTLHIVDSETHLRAPAVDLIRLFNAPDGYSALRDFLWAKRTGARVLVSPIYWNAGRFYREGLPLADPPEGESAALENSLREAVAQAEFAIQ